MNLLRGFWKLVKKYPVRAQGVIVAGVAAASAFGLGWNGAQVGAVTGLTAAILSFATESAVTSMAEPNLAVGSPVNAGSAVVASINPPPEPTANVAPEIVGGKP
jgi:hypothetical protein